MNRADTKKILVIDDEADVTDLLAYKLKQNGYNVCAVNDPLKAIGEIHRFQPDLVVLDVMMPELSGIQLCRMLRADSQTKDLPVLFLTALGETADRIKGLESGADDYLPKPFDSRELVLRVAGLLKRSERKSVAAEQRREPLQVLDLKLDPERHSVSARGKRVELTATEFRLLELLMERCGRVQTRGHLLTNVWKYEAEIETRTVDTHVRRLREKLGPCGDYIETVRGVGYRIREA